MRKLSFILLAVVALAGCKDRVIWNDNGKVEDVTENREVWDSHGKMNAEERKIWENKDGEKVIK
ncbi:MAG TPA: membrane lipoprotein lipid attachment site-containing protein [Marinobacter sp.]|nr:membrane lipoprotein lipid attachment site-containing protein [Marinobacter sp.]